MSVNLKKTSRIFLLFYRFRIIFFLSLFLGSCSNSEQNSAGREPGNNNLLLHNMVLIPAGEFIMGSDNKDSDAKPDEAPKHKVYLDAYYIDQYEITNSDYQKFILGTGSPAPQVNQEWAKPYNWSGASYPEGRGNHPVILISWKDAQAYAAWAGKRLPTEAEWEKASRGGLTGQKYPGGNTLELNHASFAKGYLRSKEISRAGSFKPNSFGLYDMAGNVWEWCQDWYDEQYYKDSPPGNPAGPSEGFYKVFRGGSWITDEKGLRCSQRGKNVPDYKSHTVGFRCALSAK